MTIGLISDLLSNGARRFGHQPLVITAGRTVSFIELNGMADATAAALQRQGIRCGDRVSLWLENGWHWMAWYYGILRCGAVVNPCNILLSPAEVAFMAVDCRATVIVTDAAHRAALTGLPGVPPLVDGIESLEEMSRWDQQVPFPRPPELSDESPSTVGYTSGTTGTPKGAVVRHASITLNTAMTALMHGRRAGDIVVSALPCTHVYGNIVMNAAVLCGMTLVLLSRFDERVVLEEIARHRATVFDGVPAMYLRMLTVSGFPAKELASLRLCTVGGQTMAVPKMTEVASYFGCPLLELWGMTEIGGLGATHPHTLPPRYGSIGIPLPLSEIKIAPIDAPGRSVSGGEIGELLIRGPLVMQGYLHNEAATRAAIEPDGWLHTGDLARQDSDGYLYVVDRAKEVIVSGGYNVYPAEVERVIAQHPDVAMVAVAAAHHGLKGEIPQAFVVLKQNSRCTEQDIIELCRSQLASYKLPRAVQFLPDLPKTSTGKILRRALSNLPGKQT